MRLLRACFIVYASMSGRKPKAFLLLVAAAVRARIATASARFSIFCCGVFIMESGVSLVM